MILFYISVDRCSSNPCKHGGTCSVTSSGYECKCQSGYSGKSCEGKFLAKKSIKQHG